MRSRVIRLVLQHPEIIVFSVLGSIALRHSARELDSRSITAINTHTFQTRPQELLQNVLSPWGHCGFAPRGGCAFLFFEQVGEVRLVIIRRIGVGGSLIMALALTTLSINNSMWLHPVFLVCDLQQWLGVP